MRRIRAVALLAALAAALPGGAVAEPGPRGSEETRRFADVPEETGGACMCTHLVYFVAKDGADDSLDVNGTIAASVRSLRAWFAREMQMAPRVDRVGDAFDITFVRGDRNAAEYTSFSRVTDELGRRGFNDSAKRYLIYAGLNRGSVCGESTFGYPLLSGPTYAALYLDSPGCGGRNFGKGTAATAARAETVAAHEWLHAEGVVPPTAPRHCALSPHHVCTGALFLADLVPDPERPDVMYPWTDAALALKVLDRERNDYLDHGLPGVKDLRTSPYLEGA